MEGLERGVLVDGLAGSKDCGAELYFLGGHPVIRVDCLPDSELAIYIGMM